MGRFLPIILPILAVVVLGLIGWRVVNNQSISTIKTDPQAKAEEAIDNRVRELEFVVTDLVSKVGSLSPSKSTVTEDRVKKLEDSLNDIKSRVVTLEQSKTTSASTTTTATSQTSSSTSTKAPSYVPLSWSGESKSTSWASITGQEFTINPADYSGYKTMQLEVSLLIFQNGTAYARMEDKAAGTAVLASEVSTTATDYTWLTSATFTLPSGSKTYRLQLKSLTGYAAQVQNARLKINF